MTQALGQRIVTPLVSLIMSLPGVVDDGALYQRFSYTVKIQILSFWSTLLTEITSGLQISSCFGLPSLALLWGRGPSEAKIKD